MSMRSLNALKADIVSLDAARSGPSKSHELTSLNGLKRSPPQLSLKPAPKPASEAVRPPAILCVRLGERLQTGGPPAPAAIDGLRAEGFEAVMDVRDLSCPGMIEAALAESDAATKAGLTYLSRPLSRRASQGVNLHLVVAEIARCRAPLYVHCEDGRAALMLGLLASGQLRGAGEVFARMAAWGAPFLDQRLRAQVCAWFDTHPAPTRVFE